MLSIILLAISLSLDAFSLALSYGIFNIEYKIKLKTSLITGIFHFIMPLIGNKFGNILISIIKIKVKRIKVRKNKK